MAGSGGMVATPVGGAWLRVCTTTAFATVLKRSAAPWLSWRAMRLDTLARRGLSYGASPRSVTERHGGGRHMIGIGILGIGFMGVTHYKAIEKVIAKALGVRASAVAVVAGRTSRDKVVRVEGVSEAELRRRLAGVGDG